MSEQPLRTVLIVDDESSIREMLAVALEMAGFETVQAENASSALEHLASRLPDLMLVDWMMPQVSGLELCRRLRRNVDTANIPLILLTARGREAKITGLGVADDYITKPFSPRELVARLKAILRRTTPLGIEEPVEFGNLRQSCRPKSNSVRLSSSTQPYRVPLATAIHDKPESRLLGPNCLIVYGEGMFMSKNGHRRAYPTITEDPWRRV